MFFNKIVFLYCFQGHTRLINYFNVGSRFYLVDLPGYGYVEGQGQGSQNFVNIVEKYLKARAGKE